MGVKKLIYLYRVKSVGIIEIGEYLWMFRISVINRYTILFFLKNVYKSMVVWVSEDLLKSKN